MSEVKHVISLGAGVQSSVVCLLSKHEELGYPISGAIFSDTGAEPPSVMDWLDWLEGELPFPVWRVKEKEGLTKALERGVWEGERIATLPMFTESEKGGGIMRRQCTNEYKIQPITQKLRELVGLKKGERGGGGVRIIQHIGISLDEIQRMRDSHLKWVEHKFPLIEKRMTRHDCLMWMEKKGYPSPPRSACVYCPYHSDAEWRRMRDEDPESWDEAKRIDELLRHGVKGANESLYLHRSLRPLGEVDLQTDEDKGQGVWDFNAECSGYCGT